ncbi:MAG: class I SAM-dependent methyltransferase [Saprospiraceae bacterium]|nr:class I SAM-dependent methyltransferase [Saprospiraceae bacterium]
MKKGLDKSVERFYNDLAIDYHLVYQNWNKSIERQATIIDQLIKQHAPQKPENILDCTCGIGTQALGLSEMGYEVHGTDISSASIERAQAEAKKRALPATFQVVDVRQLMSKVSGQFDTIISFDNSLPHLKDQQDLLLAAQHIKAKLSPHGILLGSTRDYDLLLQEKPVSTKPITSINNGIKTITFQLWDWKPDKSYVVNHFTMKELNNEFETTVRKAQYTAFTRSEMSHIFA